jgi:argininosuccinate lyase
LSQWELNNQQSRNYGVGGLLERRILCTSYPISRYRIRRDYRIFESMHEFNQSLRYDQRMHAADIRGSIAYAKALRMAGILTDSEQEQITRGLEVVGKEWETGAVRVIVHHSQTYVLGDLLDVIKFQVHVDDEDIHTANERRLSELIGAGGGKLHTGRSRNDQVATDIRLWLLDEARKIGNDLKGLIRVIVERADQEKDILMPGYTHLQVSSEI